MPTLPIRRFQGRGRPKLPGDSSPLAASALPVHALRPPFLRLSMACSGRRNSMRITTRSRETSRRSREAERHSGWPKLTRFRSPRRRDRGIRNQTSISLLYRRQRRAKCDRTPTRAQPALPRKLRFQRPWGWVSVAAQPAYCPAIVPILPLSSRLRVNV